MISPRRLLLIFLIVIVVLGVGIWQTLGQQTATPTTGDQGELLDARSSPEVTPIGAPGALGSGATSSSSWYQLAFTMPIYPDNPENHQGGLDTRLVGLMNKATRTLDVADYDFDLADVADAMAAAQERGVQVRMVTDTDTLTSKDSHIQAAFTTLKRAGIRIVDDRRSPIMHDKFTVVDGEWVETGSWNYTDGDTYHLNNNMIIIDSKALAANYTTIFNAMFAKHEFSNVPAIPDPMLTIDGVRVQNCFSPDGRCADDVVQAVEQADKSINFLAFSFTSDPIGKAMRDRAAAGVTVRGVFETTGSDTTYSEYGKMQKVGLDVYTDGNPWSMHHKVIIIDDRVVVFGSFNFSASADKSNNENLLIIDDPQLAQTFETEFAKVYAVAKNPPYKK